MAAEKLQIAIWFNGRSYPIYRYEAPPADVRPATVVDLARYGTPVLYEVSLGPDAGSWYTDIVRPATRQLLEGKVRRGCTVYVKKSSNET